MALNEPDEGPSRKDVVQTKFDIYVSITHGVYISQFRVNKNSGSDDEAKLLIS